MLNIIYPVCIYTIGHSSRTAEEFVDLLKEYNIRRLVDIRRFPGSHKFPQFNRESLQIRLAREYIEYLWAEALGGRRRPMIPDSPNGGLRSAGFRSYADYMLTEPFKEAAQQLISRASEMTTAVMCAEKLFWECHRRILSDFLSGRGMEVIHILDPGRMQKHTLSNGAVVMNNKDIHYPPGQGEKTLFDK